MSEKLFLEKNSNNLQQLSLTLIYCHSINGLIGNCHRLIVNGHFVSFIGNTILGIKTQLLIKETVII